mmetsp:Transcript_61594/g.174947  ORF Transcript_61594/g.174947 Transcript_61594/m.174947 type:complete len:296 (+) Transcript_61594:137-1024(+)
MSEPRSRALQAGDTLVGPAPGSGAPLNASSRTLLPLPHPMQGVRVLTGARRWWCFRGYGGAFGGGRPPPPRLEVLGVKGYRVLGVDMRIPGSLWTAKHAGWVPREFSFDNAQQSANEQRQGMGSVLGTLGCASAHFKVQTKAIIDNAPMAVVFEDDSWPEDDFIPRLWSLVTTELPCDWEAVALMSRCPYGVCISPHLLRVQPDGNEPAWRCHQGVNWGMHGVLYRVETLPALQQKWKAAVFDEKRPHCMDVDVALASISDKVGFYAVPAVQSPGFLYEMDEGSSRFSINMGTER